MSRAIRIAYIPLFAVLLVAAACGNKQDPQHIVASGHVEAVDVRISTKVAGTLESFPYLEGKVLKAGEEIARLDTTDNRLRLQQATAERDQAAATLKLRLAGSRKEEIAEAESTVASVRADLNGAEKDLVRMQDLMDNGVGTVQARDQAKTRRDVLTAKLRAQQDTLQKLRSGSRSEEIEAAQAALAASEARIAQLQQQIQDAVIRSPLNGVITEKIAEQGELLQTGSPLCVVTDLQSPWLTVYVGEPDLARIRLGQEVEVHTDDGQSRKGKITYISPQAEFTPKNVQTRDERVKLVFKVKVAVPNSDGLFKPGMPAEARFNTTRQS